MRKYGLNVNRFDDEATGITFNNHQLIDILAFILGPETVKVDKMLLKLGKVDAESLLRCSLKLKMLLVKG